MSEWKPGTARFIDEPSDQIRWFHFGVRRHYDMLPFACVTEWDEPARNHGVLYLPPPEET